MEKESLTFIEHGPIKISTYLIPYSIGDIVDIKANAAQQKGMPHKFYHGSVLVTFIDFTALQCASQTDRNRV
jgi:ribosomal protein L21E